MSSIKVSFFHTNESSDSDSDDEVEIEVEQDYDDDGEEEDEEFQQNFNFSLVTCSDNQQEEYGKVVKGDMGYGTPSDATSPPIILQPLHLTRTMSEQELKEFYDNLSLSITDPLYLIDSDTILRVLKPETEAKKYLYFLPVEFEGEIVHIIYRSSDMYTLGDQGIDGTIRLLDISRGRKMDKVHDALYSVGIPEYKITVVENLNYDYPDLEEVADKKRLAFKLGRSKLLKYFSNLKDPNIHNNRKKLARAFIFFAQFISESVRIKVFKQHIIDNFLGGKDHKGTTTPLFFIVYQNSWGPASNCLQRYSYKNIELCYIRYDVGVAPYNFSKLHELFGVLKYYGRDYLSCGIADEKLIMMENYRTSAKSEGKEVGPERDYCAQKIYDSQSSTIH